MELMEFENPEPGTEPLPAFRACGWNYRHVFEHCSPRRDNRGAQVVPPPGQNFSPADRPPPAFMGRELRLKYWADDDGESEGPNAAQLAAFRFVIGQQDTLLDAIVEALGDYYRREWIDMFRTELGADFPKLVDLLDTRQGVRSLLEFRAICLGEDEGHGGVAVGFYGNDPFDEEHGFGVLTRAGRVVEVGGSTTGWSF